MVRSTKRCLKKTIVRAVLTYDELLTALTEVEMILNSRPLPYVSTEDIEEPLTPSHLLRRVLSLPDVVTCEVDEVDNGLSPACPNKRRDTSAEQKMENRIPSGIKREYNREGHSNESELVSVGDIVSVHDEK